MKKWILVALTVLVIGAIVLFSLMSPEQASNVAADGTSLPGGFGSANELP